MQIMNTIQSMTIQVFKWLSFVVNLKENTNMTAVDRKDITSHIVNGNVLLSWY